MGGRGDGLLLKRLIVEASEASLVVGSPNRKVLPHARSGCGHLADQLGRIKPYESERVAGSEDWLHALNRQRGRTVHSASHRPSWWPSSMSELLQQRKRLALSGLALSGLS